MKNQVFVSGERRKREKAVLKAVDDAIRERRASYQQKELFARVGLKMGLETLSELLAIQPKRVKLSELIAGTRDGWTLDDYRIYAPEELRKNPKLYAELIDKWGGETVNQKRTLDWYRKHNPDYLKEHPEVYEKLIANI